PGALGLKQGFSFALASRCRLLLSLHNLLRHQSSIGIEEILLVILAHDGELRPINHAQLVRRNTKRERHHCVDLVLRLLAVPCLTNRSVNGPRRAGDFFPERSVGGGETVETQILFAKWSYQLLTIIKGQAFNDPSP